MKKGILLLLIFTMYVSSIAQVSKSLMFKPFIETGIVFLQNDQLINAYQTNTMFNWSAGLRIGNVDKNKLIPVLQFSRSKYSTFSFTDDIEPVRMDSSILSIQFIVGTYIPLYRFPQNTGMLRAKAAYFYASIQDEFHSTKSNPLFGNNKNAHGFQLGLGFERRVLDKSSLYIEYSYDLQKKTNNSLFRDYDTQRLTIGFVL